MLRLDIASLQFAVFDFETTGTYPDEGDEIIEIGAIHVSKDTSLQVAKGQKPALNTFETLINPMRTIPEGATQVHGIRDEDLKKAPTIDKALPGFLKFLGKRILVAQNARFDMAFLTKNLIKHGHPLPDNIVVDTMLLSQFLFPYEQKHNLDAIARRFHIKISEKRHRSIEDCIITAKVLLKFVDLLAAQDKTSIKDIEPCLLKFNKKPPTAKSKQTLALFV